MRRIAASPATLALLVTGLLVTPARADDLRNEQWHLKYLRISDAQTKSTGKGVTVAVIDTGVSEHPDLEGRVLRGIDFVNSAGSGRNDSDGHGTGMAGLIAAKGKNGNGALGIAPDARILPIRVIKGEAKAELNLGPAVTYAVEHGAKVVNISVGGNTSPETIKAFQAAASSDVVIVAAAGNRPDNVGVISPAIFDSVLAVAATDRDGKRAKVSVAGTAIDLAAPGEDIVSTDNDRKYRVGTGTSDSAAIVAGAAALVRSKFPEMSAEEVVARLESTATDKGAPGVDDEYGHGIVNIVAALSDKAAPASAAPSSSPPTPTADAAPEGEDKAEPAGDNTALIAGGAIVVLLAGLVGILWVRRRSAR